MDLGFLGGFCVYGNVYERTAFKIINAIDHDPDCVEAYRLNLGQSSRIDLAHADIGKLPRAEVLLGGFPCQDFSSSGKKRGMDSERGNLYRVLVEYAKLHRPRLIVGENVPYLAKLHGGIYLQHIARDFESVGYRLSIWKIVCQDHGLPQSRTRLFLIAIPQNEQPIAQPLLDKKRLLLTSAIADLEEIADETIPNQSQYFRASVASAGGGQGDHRNPNGIGVAYTIRANPRGRVQFHYRLDRRLTVRECARIQSFPDTFIFPYTTQRNLKLIGNAVPPIIANQIAVHIQSHLLGTCSPLKLNPQLSMAI